MDGNRSGSMPFAMIAVAILMMAVVAGGVLAEHSRAGLNLDMAEKEADYLGRSADDITAYVDQELGIIILDISRDPELGTLDERAKVFEQRSAEWIDYRFPMNSNGVTARLLEKDLDLTAESMEIVSCAEEVGGYMPSYLHGTGTLTVELSSQHGHSRTELTISTDGSYGLPLAAERGSLFERMVEDGGISVSQMVSYELQALAQYRVLNGYGAKSQFGQFGTDSIITREDVQRAYDNALEAIELICFRDADGNEMHGSVDMAERMLGNTLTIDASAFYGQVLMSVVDDVALRWFDYLCGNMELEILDLKHSVNRLMSDSLLLYLSGSDPFSARDYIVAVMDSCGIPVERYRTPGSGLTTILLDNHMITVQNPTVDVLEQSCIKQFRIHYNSDSNVIEDSLKTALNDAALRLFDYDLGTIRIDIECHDRESLVEAIQKALDNVNDGLFQEIDGIIDESVRNSKFYDPFYAAIAQTVLERAESFVLEQTMLERISDALSKAGYWTEDEIEERLTGQEVASALHSYESKVFSDLSVYDSLKTVEGEGGILHDILTEISSAGLMASGLASMVPDRSRVLVEEILSDVSMNPYSKITDLPEQGYFLLMDGSGNTTREILGFSYSNDPIIYEPVLVEKKCSHVTGFRMDLSAAYSTTFSVHIRDMIDYRINGNSSLSSAMGGRSTSSMKGNVSNDIRLEISVASAMPLAGVHYTATETILDDLSEGVYKALEPILEPLRKVMEIIRDVVDAIGSCVMEIARFVADMLAELYERIMKPITEIAQWIEDQLDELIGEGILSMFFSLNLKEQMVGFDYLGYRFTITTDLASLTTTTKTLFTAMLTGPVCGLELTASITAKVRGEVHANNVFVTGNATVKGDDWKVKVFMDPLLKSSKHLLTVSANVRGTDISVVLPELEDYHEIGVTLSRIPGIGEMIGSIPVPGLGVNIGFDAGISIKYASPVASGLIINEFESNPAGNDKGNEWIELLNNSGAAIDLEGYTITASSDRYSKTMKLSGTISPGEFLVVEPTFSMVNTSGKLTKNGEGLTLKDPDGAMIDKTGTRKDGDDNDNTWQRVYDGSGEWEFRKSTMGETNGSYISSSLMSVAVAKDIVVESVGSAFDKVGSITDMESLQEVIRLTVRYSVEKVIKQVAGCLVEASVFLKVDVLDPTSTASTGIRIALRCDSELVEDVLKYIAGQVESIALSMKNPYRIDAVSMFTDNIDLEVTFGTKIQYPKVLARTLEELPKVDLGITFRSNISALTQVFGKDTGKPELECGIRIIDCPISVIPSKLSPKQGMNHDLWLMKAMISWD